MIERKLSSEIKKRFFQGKIISVMGARQVGKSTLVEEILKEYDNYPILRLNGDNTDEREYFSAVNSTKLKNLIANHRIVFIDEAQRIPEIGLALKIMVDHFKDIQIIVTGSSSFELSSKINEPLTGRKFEYQLFGLSFTEMRNHTNLLEEKRQLDHRMIYGTYPEVVTHPGDEKKLLKWISESYLFKDILTFEQISKPKLVEKILKALALQIGNEVKYTEIAQLVGSNSVTIEKYIDIMEKAFIIFTLPALKRNVRNEIKKGKKIYFYDNGIRNALIGNFNPIHSRTDIGNIFENYLISERIKKLKYEMSFNSSYFWRTTQRQEIDYIEEEAGFYQAFEFKWSEKKRFLFSKTFQKAYPKHKFKLINRQNYEEFLLT